ncbi:hypothetical protein KCU67_g116, partial [Aureobasidium melanogenum]
LSALSSFKSCFDHKLRKLMAHACYSRIVEPSQISKRHKFRTNLTSEFRCLRSFETVCDPKLSAMQAQNMEASVKLLRCGCVLYAASRRLASSYLRVGSQVETTFKLPCNLSVLTLMLPSGLNSAPQCRGSFLTRFYDFDHWTRYWVI